MQESYYDSIVPIMNQLEFYEMPQLDGNEERQDQAFFLCLETYTYNLNKIKCYATVHQKLSPTSIPSEMSKEDILFQWCALENFALWINFLRPNIRTFLPILMHNQYHHDNSQVFDILMKESQKHLYSIENMLKLCAYDEVRIRLQALNTDFLNFQNEIKSIYGEYFRCFFSVFYHGRNISKINLVDVVRVIYSYL